MEPIWLGRFSKKATKSMVPIEGLQGEHSGAWKSWASSEELKAEAEICKSN
jgi:hypothetical protein